MNIKSERITKELGLMLSNSNLSISEVTWFIFLDNEFNKIVEDMRNE